MNTINYCAALRLFIIISALQGSNADQAVAALRNTTALPDGACRIQPLEAWSSQERWVWKQVCDGETADFNTAKGYGGALDPRKREGWLAKRSLHSQFLRTILLSEPFRSALPQSGVRIIGAWFPEPIDLNNADLAHPLGLVHCRFEGSVDFTLMKVPNFLILNESKFNALLNMTGLKVAGMLDMKRGTEFADVNLASARIGLHLNLDDSNVMGALILNNAHISGTLHIQRATILAADFISLKIDDQLSLNKSRFKGLLTMGGIQVGGSALMEDATFTDVDMRTATINQVLSLNKSNISGMLNMESLLAGILHIRDATAVKVNLRNAKIDNGLWMNDTEFGEVDLTSAKTGDDLILGRSKMLRCLTMENVRVGNNLSLRGLQVQQGSLPIQIVYADVAGSLFMEDGTLGSLDLSGTKIRGVISLGWKDHTALRWHTGSKLTLRNTEAGAIQDVANVWPDKLELIGFAYAHLGGIGSTDVSDDPAGREADWYIKWLEKQITFSPQPYLQLASVLRKSGHSDKAEEVLYAGRNRESAKATGLDFLWQLLLKFIVGYGYRTYYALFWVACLVCLGATILRVTGQGLLHKMPYGLTYSLDMLLPIVDLRERHKEIDLSGFAKYYFYFHKIMGFILVSFILAGLSGLTKLSS